MSLEDELKQRILAELGLEEWPESVDDDGPLFYEGLGLDSLDSLELIVIMRKYYGIHIDDRHKARLIFASVRAMADHIRAHRGAHAPSP